MRQNKEYDVIKRTNVHKALEPGSFVISLEHGSGEVHIEFAEKVMSGDDFDNKLCKMTINP